MANTTRVEDQYNNNKSDMKGDAEKGMRDAKDTADNVKSFVTTKAKNALESVTGDESWDDVKDHAGRIVKKAKDVASDFGGRIGDTASQAVEQASSAVKRYPFQSIAICFGLGALVGALIGSRRSS